jgi:hypothetical protein
VTDFDAQERPCARCIKRNIGHLCHDERRETDSAAKKSKSHNSNSVEDEEASPDQPQSQPSVENGLNNPFDQPTDQAQENIGLGAPSIPQSTPLQIVQPSPVSGIQVNALNSNSSHCKYLCLWHRDCIETSNSYRLRERLAGLTKSVPGYAYLSSFIYVQRSRGHE